MVKIITWGTWKCKYENMTIMKISILGEVITVSGSPCVRRNPPWGATVNHSIFAPLGYPLT